MHDLVRPEEKEHLQHSIVLDRPPVNVDSTVRNLSQPTCTMAHDDDVEVPMRDGALPLKYLSIGNGPGFQQQKYGAD